ncbi:MAG: rRNA maturation RNase YbeY [Spirochaetota bacterium]
MQQITFSDESPLQKVISEQNVVCQIAKVLQYFNIKDNYEIIVTICSDAEIQILNNQFRNKNKATDVLSFPMTDESFSIPGHQSLGEVVISFETLQRQAKQIGHGEKEEFYRLLVHGILHLLGYDHETSAEAEEEMQKLEDECLTLIFPRKSGDSQKTFDSSLELNSK